MLRLLLGVVLLVSCPAGLLAQPAVFKVESEMVSSVCYDCFKDQKWIRVQLDETAKVQLLLSTTAAVGQKLKVMFEGEVLVHTKIHTPIESGRFNTKVHTVEEAKALIRRLKPGIAEEAIAHCTPWEDECGKPYVELENPTFTLTPHIIQEACYLQASGTYTVSIRLTPEAAKQFANLTESLIGKTLALVFEGEVKSRPTVQGRIEGGRMSLTGISTLEEAKDLIKRLRPGIAEKDIQSCTILFHQAHIQSLKEPKFFKFFVEPNMVERFCLNRTPGGYGVNLQLTEPNRTWFAQTTEDLVGHGLEVIYNEEPPVKIRAHERNESGLIPLGEFLKLNEAKEFVRKLQPGIQEGIGLCN